MAPVADLVAGGADVVLTHGNGPQVGNLLVKNQLAAGVVPPVPLDWCGAQTQATIGFLIMNALERALAERGVARPVADGRDPDARRRRRPGLRRPRPSPSAATCPEAEARALIEHGQTWEDRRRAAAGGGSSPRRSRSRSWTRPPIAALLDAGYVVVAAGGGGIPVVRDGDGTLRGVEAVIDKDLAAALLARGSAPTCWSSRPTSSTRWLGFGTPTGAPAAPGRPPRELRDCRRGAASPSGSMGPKVEAARAVRRGRRAPRRRSRRWQQHRRGRARQSRHRRRTGAPETIT